MLAVASSGIRPARPCSHRLRIISEVVAIRPLSPASFTPSISAGAGSRFFSSAAPMDSTRVLQGSA